MATYQIGSIGNLISGKTNGGVETKTIVFKEVAPNDSKRSSDDVSSPKEKGAFHTTAKLKEKLKIKRIITAPLTKKRKAEISGEDGSKAVGVSYRLRSSEDTSEGTEDKSQELSTYERNAARRVHIKKNTQKYVPDPEKDSRTIFVGNIPYAHAKKQKLIKFFSKYGEVESVRLRSAPLKDPRVSKKVAVIKKEFHPERSSINGYVVFKTSQNAKSALEANGSVFHGHHLRVDTSSKEKNQVYSKNSVFLGNVPFVAEEEDLWGLFADCGPIESVRIIRDAITSVSKGVAFVNFQTSDAAELALHLNGTVLKKRTLSVSRVRPSSAKATIIKPLSAKPVRHKDADKNVQAKSKLNEEIRMAKKMKRLMKRKNEAAPDNPKKKTGTTAQLGKKTALKLNAGGTEEQTKDASDESNVKEVKEKKRTRFQGRTVEESKKKKKKINKGAQRKKKIALLLSGDKNKKKM